ncbi:MULTISPECIES: WXG100 family type VII secretion target [unclassified Nocardioides]|uniref:WXG100 family type VII secretion target n=1 Tax=unclassified Nocardioides TaxID=2615069 RepID=UPI00360D1516
MTVQVIHDAFNRGVHDVVAATTRLDADEKEIDGRVRGFLEAGWTGVAAESFVEAWDEWKAAADDVRQGLEAMGQLLDAAQRDFVQQDDASQQALDQISQRIVDRLG